MTERDREREIETMPIQNPGISVMSLNSSLYYIRIKKDERQGKQSHAKPMMHRKPAKLKDERTIRQSAEGLELGKR